MQNKVTATQRTAKYKLGKIISQEIGGIGKIKAYSIISGVSTLTISRMVNGAGKFDPQDVKRVMIAKTDDLVVLSLLREIHAPAGTCPFRFRKKATVKRAPGKRAHRQY